MDILLKEEILHSLDDIRESLICASDRIHQHPELGFQETVAAETLCSLLRQAGFQVKKGVAGMPTAFYGEYRGRGQGPKVALLAEYDALPGLGHGCGHNIIGVAAVGGAIGVSRVLDRVNGTIVVMGCPAEETGGGKINLIDQGYFKDIDFAMMIHPADRFVVNVSSLALDAWEFIFSGKAAHAASNAAEGRNALEGVIQLFNSVNSLRGQLSNDMRLNGIISEGGVAANVIPDRAVGRFYIRARTRVQLEDLVGRVQTCAKSAAEATGTRVNWQKYEPSYDDMVTNPTLARCFRESLGLLGVNKIGESENGTGSLDMGNVSRVVPSIHPYIAIGKPGLASHTIEFAQAAGGEGGHRGLLLGAKALALTAVEVMTKPHLLERIHKDFIQK